MDRPIDTSRFKSTLHSPPFNEKASTSSAMTAKRCVDVKTAFILNPYDNARKTHNSKSEVKRDDTVILDRFKDEITCLVCKKILRTPILITTCMHRICKKCLSSKDASKKCPVCDKAIQRTTIDKNLDVLINKLLKKEKKILRPSVLDMLDANGIDLDPIKKEPLTTDPIEPEPYLQNNGASHFSEPSTSNPSKEPEIKRSRSGSTSSRLMIDESDEQDDDSRPPMLSSEVLSNNNFMLKSPLIQPPPILVGGPTSKPTFIVLPKDDVYMNSHSNGALLLNDESNPSEQSSNGPRNTQPSSSPPKRSYPIGNASTSTNGCRLTPLKPKFSPNDIIQIRIPRYWINLNAEQFNLLPLSIDPASLSTVSGNSQETNGLVKIISLCENEPPTFSANLLTHQPGMVEMTPELRKLIAQLPQVVLDLLPTCCRESPQTKPFFDEMTINARRQRISRALFAPLILWPDGSVYKEDLPNCTKHPRYIYTTLEATVGHLIEYIMKRTEIEADWNDRHKYEIEITNLDEEKDEVVLLLSTQTKECFNQLQSSIEQAEFLSLKVDEGLSNTMIAIKQPFTALPHMISLAELFHQYHPNKKRPLKVVYREVDRITQS